MEISSKNLTQENASELLPLLRINHGLSQVAVAIGSGLTNQTISDVEGKKIKPRSFTILKLKRFFDDLEIGSNS